MVPAYLASVHFWRNLGRAVPYALFGWGWGGDAAPRLVLSPDVCGQVARCRAKMIATAAPHSRYCNILLQSVSY